MKLPVHSLLVLLLSCLLLGTGTQAAVCELKCDLGSEVSCHSKADASATGSVDDTAMVGMQRMHCAGGMQSSKRGPAVQNNGIRLETLPTHACGHSLSIAEVGTVPAPEAIAVVQWVNIEPVPEPKLVPAEGFIRTLKQAALRYNDCSLHVPLRV